MHYPKARRQDITETIHGHTVTDPYRWLEDGTDPEVEAWSAAQDQLLAEVFDPLESRAGLRARLLGLVPDIVGPPVVAGQWVFRTERRAGQDHAVLVVAATDAATDAATVAATDAATVTDRPEDTGASTDGQETRTLVDPNTLSPAGTTTLDGWAPSLEGDRLAYLVSEGGDEESSMWILDVASGTPVDGPVDRLRYSPLAWLPGGEALLYVRRLPPGQVPEGEEAYHRRLWLHRVGADPGTDVLLFGEGVDMTAYLEAGAADDGAWASVAVHLGTAPRNDLYVAALHDGIPTGDWQPVTVGLDAMTSARFDRTGLMWLMTTLDAPRGRLCVVEPGDHSPDRWRQAVGQDADGSVLEDFGLVGQWLIVLWSSHGLSRLTVHDRSTGEHVREVRLPGPGTADLTTRRDEAGDAWVGYTEHTRPYRVHRLDPATGELSPELRVLGDQRDDGEDETGPRVHSRRISCVSADGTEVRITVLAPTSTPDRPRPTVLNGYGGFNVAMTPAYSSSILAWVQAGGVWAVANLRGGSEEGEAWHRDGMRENKVHVYEDFEAAADALVEGGWTTREQLGIIGGSNGGLLVGAALTRSPQRYRAVVCSAPLLDMVRYELFGLGATWNDEYGRADDPVEFEWLLSYSPYHHVAEGTAYPAVLFTVFEGDTRVDTLHARKMAAALQHATSASPEERPILLRREFGVGHGARGVGRSVALAADQLAWLGDQLGLSLP